MLGISLETGQLVSIGSAIIRVTRITRGRVRVAIDGPRDHRILRFDRAGEIQTSRERRIEKVLSPVDSDSFPKVHVALNCGHFKVVPVSELNAERHHSCIECAYLDAELLKRAKALVSATEKEV